MKQKQITRRELDFLWEAMEQVGNTAVPSDFRVALARNKRALMPAVQEQRRTLPMPVRPEGNGAELQEYQTKLQAWLDNDYWTERVMVPVEEVDTLPQFKLDSPRVEQQVVDGLVVLLKGT